MQKRSFHRYLLPLVICNLLAFGYPAGRLLAQDTAITRTPEELKELFGYCEKPELVKRLKLSPETADKIGEVDYWVMVQKLSVAANTNDAYATPKEVDEEAIKKYKALHLSADQVKELLDFKLSRASKPEPCAVIALHYHHLFDTLSVPRALQLYKTPYRKMLIDKLGINGRQADMLFEVEVWKQKESLSIAAIPMADFNRIRRTVAMYGEREKRNRAVGLTDEQIESAVQFFNQHTLEPKQ
jgi:hypothetical protein